MRTPFLLALIALAACGDKDTSPVDDSNIVIDDSPPDDSQPTDADGDGFTAAEDCDDNNGDINPEAQEVCDGVDNDCDGQLDSDDDSVDENSAQKWYADDDGDGFGAGDGELSCDPITGSVENADDCDDGDSNVNPDATEVCNGLDDNCDGDSDDDDANLDLSTADSWYGDQDGDGYGDPASETVSCTQPGDTVDQSGDCDDDNSAVNPDASEVCNSADDDCDGLTDDEDDSVDTSGGSYFYADADGDGYGDPDNEVQACAQPGDASTSADDCDDSDAGINPDASEVCGGLDDDCDSKIDDDDDSLDTSSASAWYPDGDGDSYGDASGVTYACSQPDGFEATADDCDDDNREINPSATEICGGSDDDCDGDIDDADSSLDLSTASTWYGDSDNDGYGDSSTTSQACLQPSGTSSLDGDCDDSDGAVSPGASEVCNTGLDEDCSGDDNGCSLSGSYGPSEADVVYTGTASYNFGYNLSSGDVNDDGYPDVIIGAYSAKNTAGQSNAGRLYLIYGPLSTDISVDTGADAIFEGGASSDYLGKGASAAGDIDGDGYDDLVIGVYSYNGTPGTDSGGVAIHYGKGARFSGTNNGLTTANAVFYGDVKADQLGTAASIVGDVNGDGYDDMTMGANVSDIGGTNSGIGYLVPGSATRYSGNLKVGTYSGLTVVGDAGDKLGDLRNLSESVDLDGDGLHEVLFTAVNNDGTAGADTGSVHLWYGHSTIFSSGSMVASNADATLEGDSPADYLGEGLDGAGDVDGDGLEDLVIGAVGYDASSGSYSAAGAAYLVLGSTTQLSGTAAVGTLSEAVLEGGSTYDYVGASVTGGDINYDGYSDIFAGATGYDSGGLNVGAGFVWYGPLTGTITTGSADVSVSSATDKAASGRGGTINDFNNDGALDLVVGASGSNETFVLYGGGL